MLKCEPLKQLSTFALFFCVVVACKQSASSDNSTTLKSPDGKFQLTIPDGWTSIGPLEPDEIMKAVNKSSGIVVIVSFQSRANLADDLTFDKYTDLGRNQLLSKGIASDATMPESLTVNGNKASQFEAKITKENSKYINLVTTIETPDRFYRINAVAPTSIYDKSKATLKEVSGSFRAVPAARSNSN
jgi:hypothetical protein